MGDIINWPFGKAEIQSPAFAANIAVTVKNAFTIIKMALTGNATLDITVSAELNPGAIVVIIPASDGTARNLTLGTAIDGPVVAGVISKTMSQAFFLDTDGVFKPMGSFAQVN